MTSETGNARAAEMTSENMKSGRRNGASPGAGWGVVLLAHGSQRGNHTIDGLREMVRRLQSHLGEDNAKVRMACMEFIQPDLPKAVAGLVADGCTDITVMPFLLGQGTHSTEDLAEGIERSLEEYPHIRIKATAVFGADPALVEIIRQRVQAQVAQRNGSAGSITTGTTGAPMGVMLVKAGTRSQAEDHLWLYEMGRMLEEQLGAGFAVAVAQSHFGPPTMEEAVADLVERQGAASVTCVPYIFFPGLILTRNIVGGVKTLERKYPGVGFAVTPTLGVDDGLVELTARRILDAAYD
ncbi:MAG: sirohydrochlorin chelatase [Chloroflexi bacterium]|nr:sirohydrochlorin chelatase [Chloroflexota bacterium]